MDKLNEFVPQYYKFIVGQIITKDCSTKPIVMWNISFEKKRNLILFYKENITVPQNTKLHVR